MNRRLFAIVIIVLIALNTIVYRVSAEELKPVESEPADDIIRVVVPTSYNLLVDPYEIFCEGSMIASPEYSIINKSSVPIKVDIAFQMSAREGINLDINKNRNKVGQKKKYDIWLGACFNNDIKKVITEENYLKTQQGDIIYQYLETPKQKTKEKTKAVSGASISVAATEAVSGSSISLASTEAVSGSSISVASTEAVSGSSISVAATEAVSGSSISVAATEAVSGASISVAATEAVSGSSISVDTTEIVRGVSISVTSAEAVSGSTITVASTEAVSGSAITVESTEAVSGSAISVASAEAVSGSAITVVPAEAESGSAISTKIEDVKPVVIYSKESIRENITGTPVIYHDTVKIIGSYGDLGRLDETYSNVLVIGNEWNSKSFVLEKARRYRLADGTVLTGEAAGDNGAVAFRFIGSVNATTLWSETELDVKIKYTFNIQADNSNSEDEISSKAPSHNNANEEILSLDEAITKTEYRMDKRDLYSLNNTNINKTTINNTSVDNTIMDYELISGIGLEFEKKQE